MMDDRIKNIDVIRMMYPDHRITWEDTELGDAELVIDDEFASIYAYENVLLCSEKAELDYLVERIEEYLALKELKEEDDE